LAAAFFCGKGNIYIYWFLRTWAACQSRTVNQSRGTVKIEPKKFSLCPICTACPEVVITNEGVITIDEGTNTERLSRDARNELSSRASCTKSNRARTRLFATRERVNLPAGESWVFTRHKTMV
jgi:hypothetical protein